MEFQKPIEKNINFGLLSKRLPSSGNLAWEYNPFRNYRLTKSKYFFRNKFFSKEELEEELGKKILEEDKDWSKFKKSDTLPNGISDQESDPVFYDAGQLVDFDTSELNFDINHPVDILPQWSYDGSVNLILNDGKNPPRLINSRFSPLGMNKYQIVDRKGGNDTNIYDQGEQFESDTSLYKTYIGIPKLEFLNVYQSGNLAVGNYHFYFKYLDADGNETDFVAESGLVSIFKGTTLNSITSGFREENSFKSVKFLLSNVDPAYSYVKVYFTKSTSDIHENATTSAYRIEQDFLVNNSSICTIYITGAEDKTEIPLTDINPQYQVAQNVQTQDTCQNMLFFGNVQKVNIDYAELTDLSLRFCPTPDYSKTYNPVPHNYNNTASDTYSDPKFIYNYVGYAKKEIYRFGIVYLMNDGTLSPVFNIRGLYFDADNYTYNLFKIYEGGKRNKILYNEDTGILYKQGDKKDSNTSTTESLENAFGVVRIDTSHDCEVDRVIGIKIIAQDDTALFEELRKHNIKGYFFVRQKRIPLRLCQALTIGVDGESNTPVLFVDNRTVINSKSKPETKDGPFYIAERFLTDDKILSHTFEDRLYGIKKERIYKYGAICPEYDINYPYLNTLFCGDQYIVEQVSNSTALQQDPTETRHFYINNFTYAADSPSTYTNIIGVEDNVKLVETSNIKFSSRAGEAEEAFRYEYITSQIKSEDANNLIRGSFGPFLGFSGYNVPGTLVNIYIKDYLTMRKEDLFKIRYNDKSSYYAISERYDIKENFQNDVLYRGDTYICTFTHRVNRNFQDPSAPTNHQVVDENCWKDNYTVTDNVVNKEKFEKINLGDVNAIKVGMWVTFQLVSSINLNIRSLDSSYVDEEALTGHPRTFYPYSGMDAEGTYKTPEALCYNKGFDKSVSERWNYEVPDVPAIKNDFTNRISYSNVNVSDAFQNGFRVFQGTHYRDYPKTYGQITKLVELRGGLLCVFEHGVALIPVNERAVAGEGSGGNIYINTSNVLPENPKIISDTFGSQWKDSIIKTPRGVYGVDTVGKKIWRTNGEEFECLSDFRIQEFLNQNISLTERELEPIIGVRNVKTHYNKFKGDVMFTFYDNLYGFEEKVWNICFNEGLQKWITFYSWVPSYSENIYNQYFSFDRNTSKWITKLGISKKGNDFSDGVVLTENIIPNDAKSGYKIGDLDLANRTLPSGDGINVVKTYELVPDNFGNWNNFKIENNSLYLRTDAVNLCSEFFVRGTKSGSSYTQEITDPKNQKTEWINNCVLNSNYVICKDERGRRINLAVEPNDKRINGTSPVILLNIRANIKVEYTGTTPSLGEAYASGFTNKTVVDAGYYQSVVAVTPKYNMQFLTTDFWKHGQAGIIDIADKIYPTYWYGKQHPFEFEFIVAANPQLHKIFDNLEIISNNAEPESFHYEIIGDCYDFSKDKKNMYIRQEATKELYQYNGFDVLYDHNYNDLQSEHRLLTNNVGENTSNQYDKSTLFPLYYSRRDSINEIEDFYHLKDNIPTKDFSALSGAEIVRYENLNEYRIWNHAKAIDLNSGGRLRGNMQYKEDKWNIQINPLNLVQKNEGAWIDLGNNPTTKIPVELGQSPIPNEVLTNEDGTPKNDLSIPDSFKTIPNQEGRGYVVWKWEESQVKEAKLKDKFMKVRIRYSGKNLAIISAIRTLYSASYS